MAIWKSAPALAAGNAFVFKPAPLTPLSATRLADIYREAGCPDGLYSAVLGGVETGQALVSHPLISKISFTGIYSLYTFSMTSNSTLGSDVGGREVLKAAAQKIIPSTVELGGKSALIVMPDADIDEAAKGAVLANFFSQGQVCSNAARIFVHK